MKAFRTLWLLLAACALAAAPAHAQGNAGQGAASQGGASQEAAGYPNQTVRIIVPFSAGSFTDIMARVLADRMSKNWKENVIVENRPGLAGTTAVAKATPDGYTLMVTSNGHTIAPAINKNVQFDPVKDFAAISRIANVPLVFVVPPDLPVNSLAEFIEYAKQRPGQLNFSSAGVASTSFLSGEVFRQNGNLKMQHVPYRGAPEALNAVMRGDAQLYAAANIQQGQELGASNKVKVLAVGTDRPVPELPNVPTVAQALPDYKYDSWFGLFAPAGTPQPIVDKISREVQAILKDPEVVETLRKQGFVAAPTTPAEFDAINKGDVERYAQLLREAGVAAQ